MENNQEAFVYCWTDHKTNKIYVGSHKGTEKDGYICSSKQVKEEYNKRPEDFSRQILARGLNRDIRELERKILQSIDARHDPMFYNKHNGDGKFVNCGPLSETHKANISKSNKGKKTYPGAIPPLFTGKKHTQETKDKISLTHKGKTISEQTREKIGLKRLGSKHTETSKQKIRIAYLGRIWINNGKESKFIPGNLMIPLGFVKGRKISTHHGP